MRTRSMLLYAVRDMMRKNKWAEGITLIKDSM